MEDNCVYFVAERDGQVYLLSMEGGEAHPLTKLSTGADLAIWSPDGKTIAFTSACIRNAKTTSATRRRMKRKKKNRVKAHVAEALLYRHWTHWNDGKRSHLFVIAADGSGAAKDLAAGAEYDVPPDQRARRATLIFLRIRKRFALRR